MAAAVRIYFTGYAGNPTARTYWPLPFIAKGEQFAGCNSMVVNATGLFWVITGRLIHHVAKSPLLDQLWNRLDAWRKKNHNHKPRPHIWHELSLQNTDFDCNDISLNGLGLVRLLRYGPSYIESSASLAPLLLFNSLSSLSAHPVPWGRRHQ